jgi:glucosamine--fructose-6-phosphate aminotransferase (isomerizing)
MSASRSSPAGDRSRHGPGHPELREGPPWVMEDMIAAQACLASAILEAPAPGTEAIAAAVMHAAAAGAPVVVTGCGTSEHGAMAVAELLAEALRSAGVPSRPEARQALDAALDPRGGGICIGVSHEGTTRATILALGAARAAGAVTATIGARSDSPLALAAEHALTTPLTDRSWCHTVAYSSTILAGAAVARAIAGGQSGGGASIANALALRAQVERLSTRIDGALRILTVGLGADLITARELALKIEEGARIPATALHLESLLHGHLAGCDAETTALVLFAADARQGVRRDHRLTAAAGAAAAIGIPTIAIGGEAALTELPGQVERLSIPAAGEAQLLHALLTGAVTLQLLTLALAHLAGSNPDLIRREQHPYREAGLVAGNRADW